MDAATTDIAQSFSEYGFAVVPNLFLRQEVKALKKEAQRILDEVRQESGGSNSAREMLDATGVYVGMAVRSGIFRQAARDERLVNILEAIIGPNVEFLSDKVVYKDTDTHTASPWHQDWPYWEGTHKVSIWVAFDDATPENGCLKLMPGSHRGSIVHDGDSSDGIGFGHRVRPETVDESAAVTAPLEAGGGSLLPRPDHARQPPQYAAPRTLDLDSHLSRRPGRRSPLFVCRRQLCGSRRRAIASNLRAFPELTRR